MKKSNGSDKTLKQQLREQYLKQGLEEMSNKEITSLLLTYSAGSKFDSLADTLIKQYSSLNAIIDADSKILLDDFQIDEKTLVLLRLIPQLSKIYFMESKKIKSIPSSELAIKYFESLFIGALEEQFVAVCTDENFNIIQSEIIFHGTVSSLNASCREIAEFAIKNHSSRLFIAHNHPMGSATPSANDYSSTDLIFRTLKTFSITLIDHIIIGKSSAVSMRELPYTLSFKSSDSFGYILADPR